MSTGLHSSPPPLSSATQSAAEAGGLDPATNEKFILVGLHTCGDLGPTMFRVLSQCDQMVGLVSVGCCYMKLTCPPSGLSRDGEGLSRDGEGPSLQEACSQDTHVLERPQVTGPSGSEGDNGSSGSSVSCGGQGTDSLHVPERTQIMGNSGDCDNSDVDLQLLKLETRVSHDRCSKTESSYVDPNCSLLAQAVTEKRLPAFQQNVGYPLSEFVRSLPSHGLSYEARELACHAIETYRERLQGNLLHHFNLEEVNQL